MRRLAALACAATLVRVRLHLRRSRAGPVPDPGADASEPAAARGAQFLPQADEPEPAGAGDAHLGERRGLPVTFRFAVHAVRRTEGATVLDWSVTPLRRPGFELGDDLPGSISGSPAPPGSDVNIALLDPEPPTRCTGR